MILYTNNAIVYLHFYIGSTGIANGAFTKTLYKNGATSGETVTVTEIGSSGYYYASFTPTSATSHYFLEVYRTSQPNVRYTESYQDKNLVASAALNTICESEGSYTAQQILSILLSFAAGRTSGNGLTFKTPNDAATRIVGTVDVNDNRTAITLTPSA